MIKKNTKIVIEANGSKETEELEGGIPLSKGETVMIRKDGTAAEYEVSEKKTEIFYENDDRIVSISYHLRKMNGPGERF